MKKFILLFAAILMVSGISYAQSNSVSGHIYYFPNKIMHDSVVVMLYQGTNMIYSQNIQPDGSYLFQDITAGSYTVKATCNKIWGGANAMDALMISLHFIGSIQLTGIQLTAGDVNGSGGTPGTVDALATLRRFTGLLSSFMPPNVPPPGRPDWLSQSFQVELQDAVTVVQDIRLICTGDVNASYNPQ